MATREISADELAKHGTVGSAWIEIHGTVYDVTLFQHEHPGGSEIVVQQAGKVGVAGPEFDSIGHSDVAKKQLAQYQIGKLKK